MTPMEKILLVMAFILVLLTCLITYQEITTPNYFEHNGVKLSMDDYAKIKEEFKDMRHIVVCDMETNKCITLTKLE